MNENKNIETILRAREKRYFYQKQLVKEYKKTLVALKLNIPGPKKDGELYREIFNNGLKLLKVSLNKAKIKMIFKEIWNKSTGSEAFIIVDTDAIKTKKICTEIEETDGLGRIYDFDVMDALGNSISRESIGKEQRKCFLCDKYVWVCSRTRAHSIDEMLTFIEKTAKAYFIKNKREEIKWQ
ncbi:citrate lyase holo-[acyl-carrier protein] synthase [Crassaminicella profunda]|uniref:citrate lyase holo-[acyl-carrier protein] synthase n=1 Tax=Crassaminicella profunda TaxID=1286698 RepID=UPI001CA68DF4|nr:citrate lyase holo-[acyl-carrier protein] synthase [Crassaminicella profunda]QZY53617.1 citrate lyase holo-[acyl-carrier protein] synthase [Crassaminicella profunda]